VEVALALAAGLAAGFALGSLLVGARYVRALEQLRDITPGHPVGQVYMPPLVPDSIVEPAFDQDTIDRGAREILEELQAVGRSIPWDEAQRQAQAMLTETMPLVR
jgi:hypothetical protein